MPREAPMMRMADMPQEQPASWNVLTMTNGHNGQKAAQFPSSRPFATDSAMPSISDIELARRLRTLRRTVLMLQTELRHGHVDEGLIAEIDQQLDHGLGVDSRCERLPAAVDALRENTMTPRAELHGDTIRACERLKDEIEAIISRLG